LRAEYLSNALVAFFYLPRNFFVFAVTAAGFCSIVSSCGASSGKRESRCAESAAFGFFTFYRDFLRKKDGNKQRFTVLPFLF